MHKFTETVILVSSVDNPTATHYITTLEDYITGHHHRTMGALQYVVSLLSIGKIRITSKARTDRLQLANRRDLISRIEALGILEDYLLTLDRSAALRFAVDATQKIFLHTPVQEDEA